MKLEDLPFQSRYFSSYPIEDEFEALWFSKKINLAVVDLLWRAGPNGLKAKELSELIEKEEELAGRSQVYETLKELYMEGNVGRSWDKNSNSHRNYLAKQWRPVYLEEDFQD